MTPSMNRIPSRGAIASALFLLSAGALAQPVLDERARAMAERHAAAGGASTLVIGLIEGDRSTVVGFSAEGSAKPDGRSLYEIGSVTKTFTALLLAQEIAAGRLKPEDPVSALLPAMKLPAFEGQPITLVDLATQTSGLPRLPSNLKPKDIGNPYVDYDGQALGAFLGSYQLPVRPGERYEYTNLGYGLLGYALASRAKQSYGELVKTRILDPLGMTSTGMTVDASARDRWMPGHGPDGRPVPGWDFDALAGAGALKSDVNDLLLYLRAAMRGASESGTAFNRVQTPLRDTGAPGTRIGYAWHVTTLKGQQVVWHNGMTGGYASFIGFTADGRRGVVVLASVQRTVDSLAMTALLPELAPRDR